MSVTFSHITLVDKLDQLAAQVDTLGDLIGSSGDHGCFGLSLLFSRIANDMVDLGLEARRIFGLDQDVGDEEGPRRGRGPGRS